MKQIDMGNFVIGDNKGFVLIAGPCVLENEEAAMDIAGYLQKLTDKLKIPYIFKASYDKANRTSINSYRGPGSARRRRARPRRASPSGCRSSCS